MAQSSPDALGGFYGLIYTPAGALPSVILVKNARDSASRGWVSLRHGKYKYRDDILRFSNYGMSGQVRVWRSVHVGATYGYRTCNSSCSGLSMYSVDAAGTLLHRAAQVKGEADTEIGFQLTAGYGKASTSTVDLTATSVTGFLPMTVTLPQSYDGILTLTLLPGVSFGSLNDNTGSLFLTPGTYASARFMVGAGLGYLFPMGLGLHVVVHRIAVEESTTQSGLLASWRF